MRKSELCVFRSVSGGAKRRRSRRQAALAEIQNCHSLGLESTFYAHRSTIVDHTQKKQAMENQDLALLCHHRLQSDQEVQQDKSQLSSNRSKTRKFFITLKYLRKLRAFSKLIERHLSNPALWPTINFSSFAKNVQ